MIKGSRVILHPQFGSVQRIIVEQIDELHQLYCGNEPLILPINCSFLTVYEGAVIFLNHHYLWQEHLVNRLCMCFSLKKGEPHLFEFRHRENLPWIFAHLINLLPQIVQDPVVHIIPVHLSYHF